MMLVDSHRIHAVKHFLPCGWVFYLHEYLCTICMHISSSHACLLAPNIWFPGIEFTDGHYKAYLTWSDLSLGLSKTQIDHHPHKRKLSKQFPSTSIDMPASLDSFCSIHTHACHSPLGHFLKWLPSSVNLSPHSSVVINLLFNFFGVRNGLKHKCGGSNYSLPELMNVKF